jgi:hypothetical protein
VADKRANFFSFLLREEVGKRGKKLSSACYFVAIFAAAFYPETVNSSVNEGGGYEATGCWIGSSDAAVADEQ